MPTDPYKILGRLTDETGVGVLGHNAASSGRTRGVEGRVDSPDGYGLYTDDDAHVGGELRTGELNGVRYAETAADIQPAIDELAKLNAEGEIRGGTVKLLQKAYYPETTIWLKRGVTLEGTRGWPAASGRGNDAVHSTEEEHATTLYTDRLPEGNAFDPYPTRDGTDSAATYRHFNSTTAHDEFNAAGGDKSDTWMRENTHPHLPVVGAFNEMPIYDPPSHTPEEYTREFWGDGVALRNLRIWAKPGERRYWDPADEPDGSLEQRQANYYGLYDGFIFENLLTLRVENVRVGGFRGYNGFYQDIRNVVSQGNHYGGPGTATDHHGSTLQIGRSNSATNRYMRGLWTVKVAGPTPTVEVGNHAVRSQFLGGGPIKPVVTGRPNRWCNGVETRHSDDGEAAYDAGDAPIVNPANKHRIVFQPDPWVQWKDYRIEQFGGAEKVALSTDKRHLHMSDCVLERPLVMQGGKDVELHDSTIQRLELVNWQPYAVGCKFPQGMDSSSRANFQYGFHNCVFGDDGSGASLRGGVRNMMLLNNCHLTAGIDSSDSWRDHLVLANPTGYTNENGGSVSFAGGSSGYSIAHGLDEDPPSVSLTPTTRAAAVNDYWVETTASSIDVTFETAPSNTVGFTWQAAGWSSPHNRTVGTTVSPQ